jgi:hypothetical protein
MMIIMKALKMLKCKFLPEKENDDKHFCVVYLHPNIKGNIDGFCHIDKLSNQVKDLTN